MTMLDCALSYARAGLAVLPLWWMRPDGTCACGKEGDCKKGKHPLGSAVPRGVLQATTDEAQIRAWWTRYPLANIGIASGEVSGHLYWLDFDEEAERVFPAWKRTLQEMYPAVGALPFAVVQTGRGYRAAWRVSGDVALKSDPNLARSAATDDKPKGSVLVESRGEGGYGVAPPSIHENGRTFTTIEGDLLNVPVLSPEDHARVLRVVRSFHTYQEPAAAVPITMVRGGAFGKGLGSGRPVARKSGGGLEIDKLEMWRRLDVPALASLLGDMEPRPTATRVECRCPACGQHRAYVYPSNGVQGVSIRCNRANNCAYEKTLVQYLTDRHGTTAAAWALLSQVSGVPQTMPANPFTLQRSTPNRTQSDTLTRARADDQQAGQAVSVPVAGTAEQATPPPTVQKAAPPEPDDMEETPEESTPLQMEASEPPAEAFDQETVGPALMVQHGSVPKRAAYGIVNCIWTGPGVETARRGRCGVCSAEWAPLAIEGNGAECVLCWQADQRAVEIKQPKRCQVFCEQEIDEHRRCEPGGLLACPDCAARIHTIQERMRGKSARDNGDIRIRATS